MSQLTRGNKRMKLQPIAGYVLLEAETRAEAVQRDLDKRLPGFDIAEPKHQGAPETGIVRYVAADIKSVKPGDKVRFTFTERGFEIDGQKLIRVKIDNVLGIVGGRYW